MLLEDINRRREQAEDFSLKNKFIRSVLAFVEGPIQAFLFHSFGLIAALPAAAAFMGAYALGIRFVTNNRLDSVTNSYRDELAQILGKSRSTITREDFADVAQALPSDNPIRRDYEAIRVTARTTQLQSVVRNILISAAVIGFVSVGGPWALEMVGYGIIGGGVLAIDMLVENTFGKFLQRRPTMGAGFVDHISAELSKGPVTPAKLMEFSAQTDPRIKAAIQEAFWSDYATLNFQQKQEAIAMLGQGPFLSAIARDLNEGRIRPSELPFLLSGQDSPSTPIRRYTLPPAPAAPTHAAEAVALTPSQHIHEAEPHGPVSTLSPARVLH
jgi:hypothetical protein